MFNDFNSDSRVWVYQSDRLLLPSEVTDINKRINTFTNQWTAHQLMLKAGFEIQYGMFLIFCVDERTAQASGCSIDKLFHQVQQLEKDFNIRLIDRKIAAYKSGDKAIAFNIKDLNMLYSDGIINNDTLMFNNLVSTLDEFNKKWLVSLKESWMSQLISVASK